MGEENILKFEIRFSTPNPSGRVVFGSCRLLGAKISEVTKCFDSVLFRISQISIFQIEIGGGWVGAKKVGTKIEILIH